MKRWIVLIFKVGLGFAIVADWFYWIGFELAMSTPDTFDAAFFLQRISLTLAYMAWIFWPLLRVGPRATPTAEPREDDRETQTASVRNVTSEHMYGEATDAERATWICEIAEHDGTEDRSR